MFFIGIISLFILYIFIIGWGGGEKQANNNATKYVCTREVYPAPKEWCNETLLKEIYLK